MVRRQRDSYTRWISSLLALLVVTSGAGVVAAQSDSDAASDQPGWAEEAFAEYEDMVAIYNESIASTDLGIAGDQLTNERVNLVVTDADGSTATFSFRTDSQLRMTEVTQGTRSDATIRMSTDRETLNETLTADDPAAAFTSAVAEDDIEIDGLGTTNAVKWTVVNTAADLARSLGLF